MTRRESDERIEAAASLWAARLDGGVMNEMDRAALTAWLEENPDHRWVLSRYRQLSAEIDERLGEMLAEAALAPGAGRRKRRSMGVVFAAAAAAIALVALLWSSGRNNLATKPAERHVAVLRDGSRVELNAQTELQVKFDRHARRVRLARGEALFDVAKETARPFIVETPTGIVRVTGTVFNVRALWREGVEITVLDGRVRVTPGHGAASETALEPGEQALLTAAEATVRTLAPGAVQDVVAWREGQAVFEATPLREALDRFAAYHGRPIDVDGRVANLRLGGRYSLDDLEGFLEQIERVLAVRVLRQSPNIVRVVPIDGE